MSELSRDFIVACLRKKPQERPTIAQLLHHPWVRSYMVRVCVVACRRQTPAWAIGARVCGLLHTC